jgi:ABC-2 type transport system permease protein
VGRRDPAFALYQAPPRESMPATSAVGIAAGLFAGEAERGVLTPILASPASNLSIFAGKVIGAILPPLLYALVAETIFIAGVAVLLESMWVRAIPGGLGLAMLLLVPGITCLAAAIASVISSRVRTYNAAQQLTGIALAPVYAIMFFLAGNLGTWGERRSRCGGYRSRVDRCGADRAWCQHVAA